MRKSKKRQVSFDTCVFGALTIHVYEQKKLLNKLKI